MAIRLTTKFVEELAAGRSLRELLADSRFYLYSQSQPTDADNEPNGIQLVEYTLDGNAFVAATAAYGTLTIGGGAGNVLTVSIGGMAENLLAAAVPWNTTNEQTAIDVAASINSKQNSMNLVASAVGAVVNITGPAWLGADLNGLTLASTVDGATTATPAPFANGVDAVNGLTWDFPADGGIIVKPSGEAWKGLGLANDNAGWFRIVAGGSAVTGDGADNVRIDGIVATSGGDIQTGSNVITLGTVQTIGNLSIQIPRVKV